MVVGVEIDRYIKRRTRKRIRIKKKKIKKRKNKNGVRKIDKNR